MMKDGKVKSGNGIEEYRFYHTSVILSRKKRPVDSDDDWMIAVIKIFDVNNPHKTAELPVKTLEFRNIEKFRIRNLNVSYYLEGNDIIINDIEELYIRHNTKKHKVIVRAFQRSVEERGEAIF